MKDDQVEEFYNELILLAEKYTISVSGMGSYNGKLQCEFTTPDNRLHHAGNINDRG